MRRYVRTDFPGGFDRLRYLWWLATRRHLPRGVGVTATALLVSASVGYGVLKGDHVAIVVAHLKETRDAIANAAGFGIQSLSLIGRKNLAEKDILAAAGITDNTSLLFLDVEAARRRLTANPWIAEAAVRKFYPGRLQIKIVEREAFALWQESGNLHLIAADGAVLGPFTDRRFAALPFVVGRGAETQAKQFLAVLDGYPSLRAQVRAAVRIAERRWNLRLTNGLDIRLPELDVARALDTLTMLDREKKLLSRDITAIDLRLPDRVSVRLSEAAAQAREDALKAKKQKRKGGDA
jgi:cell division protein FtsQ